jgi:N-acetylglucosaminyldiphosphoundecaprenol N-acetyl-beta-D-mannosaminyltransferase
MKLFGLNLQRLARRDPAAKLLALLEAGSSQVITLNPEMALAARQDERLRRAINDAALILADGIGLAVLVGANRLTGADALELLVSEAHTRQDRVLLLGGAPGEAGDAADALRARFSGLEISGDGAGDVQEIPGGWTQEPDLLGRIRTYRPAVLAVAFGHGKQEAWIAEHLKELPSVRVAVGVGGTFAYLSGRIPRAPGWMRVAGLEWLWRLVREPSRIGRIFRAVVVFPALAVWDMISPTKTV